MKLIKIAESDAEIESCYNVMAELRPHLVEREFVERVKRQAEQHGFQVAFLTDGEVKAVAGIRIAEWLASGKYLEIEDLVTKSGERSSGYGGELFDWIVELARREECCQLRLVSSVTRFGAHRFYLRKGMNIEAHYFSMDCQ
jgi:GNAT superfamily N-acetyltransferase